MSSEVEFKGREVSEEEDDELLEMELQLRNFRRLPKRSSLMEATAQRKRMKKTEEMTKRRCSDLGLFIIIISNGVS